MKVPSVDEARKIVSDADLGVGCVTDDKELVLAQFVFNYAPSGRNPAFIFKEELQSIVNAAEKQSEPDCRSYIEIARLVHSGFISMDTALRSVLFTILAAIGLICFVLGVILYKIS